MNSNYRLTSLNDGNILASGGYDSNELILECEVFDATTKKWSIGSSLITGRINHNIIKLNDGKIIIYGGEDISGSTKIQSLEILNPSDNSFSKLSDFKGSSLLNVLPLANNKIFLVSTDAAQERIFSEIYDFNTGWQLIDDSPNDKESFILLKELSE